MSDYPTVTPTDADIDRLKAIEKWYSGDENPLVRVRDEEGNYIGLIHLDDLFKVIKGIGLKDWIQKVRHFDELTNPKEL